MIADEQVAQIRHLFHAEHWKIGTIAAQLNLHPDTVIEGTSYRVRESELEAAAHKKNSERNPRAQRS